MKRQIRENLTKCEDAIILLSPGNSAFSEDSITELVKMYAGEESARFLIVEGEYYRTLMAQRGYDQKKAKRKARLMCNNTKNKARRVATKLGKKALFIGDKVSEKDLEEVKRLYEENKEFRSDARQTTANVVGREQIEIGIHYLLSELALFKALAAKGEEGIVYVRNFDIGNKLLQGEYDHKKTNLRVYEHRLSE